MTLVHVGSRANRTQNWEILVLVVVLASESKALYHMNAQRDLKFALDCACGFRVGFLWCHRLGVGIALEATFATVSPYFKRLCNAICCVFKKHQLNSKNNDPVLLLKTIFTVNPLFLTPSLISPRPFQGKKVNKPPSSPLIILHW